MCILVGPCVNDKVTKTARLTRNTFHFMNVTWPIAKTFFFFFLKVVHPQNEGKNKLVFQCLCRDVVEAAMTTLQMVMSCYFVMAAAASPNNAII